MNSKKYFECAGHCPSCCVGLRDFTRVRYHYKNNFFSAFTYDEASKQRETIITIKIDIGEVLRVESNDLINFLGFTITNEKCKFHDHCVLYYLYSREGKYLDRKHKHFNSIQIYCL
jgi:hypothetical protein